METDPVTATSDGEFVASDSGEDSGRLVDVRAAAAAALTREDLLVVRGE